VNANLLNGKNVDLPDDKFLFLNEESFYNQQLERNNCCFFNCCCASTKSGSRAAESTASSQQNASSSSNSDVEEVLALNLTSLKSCAEKPKTDAVNYSGHFIILIGYDDNKHLVFYRNPASKRNFSFTSYANFELARRSYGTDQDLLFLSPS
jgi:hypothetical protein